MDFELVVVQGRSGTSTIKLTEPVTTIGRHDECQLRIKSSQVSRRHCELFEKKGHLLVKDLGSANGTLVNGKRVQGQLVLEPGDELSIGPVLLRVAKVGAAPAGAPGKASPGDTAVSAAPVAPAAAADEFTIDLDEPAQPPDAATVPAPARAAAAPTPAKKKSLPHDEDAIADFLLDIDTGANEPEEEPATEVVAPAAPPVAEATAPPAEPEVKPAPEAKVKEAEASDDAIADFLLDIQIDEEE